MVFRTLFLSAFLLCLAAALAAQSNPEYVEFSPRPAKGALYRPDRGTPPHVGVLLMHRTSNFLSHMATQELSRRGFLVLAMNPRFDNNEAAVEWEQIALDVRSGVEYLRKQPGITKIVLFGHSGGGSTMSYYQAVAEKGPSYCQGTGKLSECGNEVAGLPKADGLILMDAHPSNPVNALRSLNPALISDNDPRRINPALDPFNPANGYNPDGPSHYSEAFQKKYFQTQAERMNRLIEQARTRLQQIKAGQAAYPDNDIFLVVRGVGARLMQLDPSIHHATAKPRKLLRNDGTVVTQIIESVRRASPELAKQNGTFENGTRLLTLRSFLSANAIRSRDSMNDIDWCSSNNSVPCALGSISVPLLIAAMGGHYFIRDNEIHYEMAASADKDFIVVEGATHGATPCEPCETTPGQYSNTVKNFFNYVQTWINDRF